jgi:hypothetical protein
LVLIEQVYFHLALKRAMHAVNPMGRLTRLKGRLRAILGDEFVRTAGLFPQNGSIVALALFQPHRR